MHGTDDPQIGQLLVRDLFGDQRLRDNSDNLAAGRAGRVRQHAHQSDIPTSVDNRKSAGH